MRTVDYNNRGMGGGARNSHLRSIIRGTTLLRDFPFHRSGDHFSREGRVRREGDQRFESRFLQEASGSPRRGGIAADARSRWCCTEYRCGDHEGCDGWLAPREGSPLLSIPRRACTSPDYLMHPTSWDSTRAPSRIREWPPPIGSARSAPGL